MESSHDQLLKETYQLVRDNNRMLHAMRRNAFLGGIFHLLVYAAILGGSGWLYLTYVHPILVTMVGVLDETQQNIEKVKDVSTEFGAQFGGMEKLLEQLKSIPGMGDLGEKQ